MITSSHNPKIQMVKSLIGRRQVREDAQAFVVEGIRLAEEALLAGWVPSLVLHSGEVSERGQAVLAGFLRLGCDVEETSPKLLALLADTETSQGLLVVFSCRNLPLPEHPDFLLVADRVRDPGNLGSLLRTAAAAGVQGVLLGPGTTDAFSPKVVRAGMGAHFHLPILNMDWVDIQRICQPHTKMYLAEAGAGTRYWDVDLRQPVTLVVGGEAEGASREARRAADQLVSIPMPGKSESLNAAVAASILMFEVVRQRSV